MSQSSSSINPSSRTLVIIPTYNERENVPRIVSRVRRATPDVDVLIIDDNSPDGTGDVAEEYAASDDHVFVIHRAQKEGLLAAYREGFEWGLARDYTALCEMDADGSHAPEELPLLLERLDQGADLVIGSRYIPGGRVVNWPKKRYILSKGGNLYIGLLLGAGLTDMTAGYRAFRREVLESLDFNEISRAGYIFQVDIALRAVQNGYDVAEVPITFTEREIGESKLAGSFVKDSLCEVTKWGLAHRLDQGKNLAVELVHQVSHEIKRIRTRPRTL